MNSPASNYDTLQYTVANISLCLPSSPYHLLKARSIALLFLFILFIFFFFPLLYILYLYMFVRALFCHDREIIKSPPITDQSRQKSKRVREREIDSGFQSIQRCRALLGIGLQAQEPPRWGRIYSDDDNRWRSGVQERIYIYIYIYV